MEENDSPLIYILPLLKSQVVHILDNYLPENAYCSVVCLLAKWKLYHVTNLMQQIEEQVVHIYIYRVKIFPQSYPVNNNCIGRGSICLKRTF